MSASGKVLALDVGLARIGVAVSDPLGLAARPLLVLERRARNEDFAVLARLVNEQEIVAVLCGLPLNMDGSESTQSATTRKWALRLAQALRAILGRPVPLIYWDERLSSYAARELIVEGRLTDGEDAVAAAVFLQSYLDAQRGGETPDYGRIELPPRV